MMNEVKTENTVAREYHEKALAALDAARQERAAAADDLESARYERSQADHRRREIGAIEQNVAQREKWLRENGEDVMRERERLADEKFKAAEELMRQYNRDRHQALLAVQRLEASEAAAKASRGKAVAA
jgi:hypothetical protein